MGGNNHGAGTVRKYPGMQHCGNGPGPNEFDALGALVRWVEGGIPPDSILASHKTLGVVDRTRPLCPYPAVALVRERKHGRSGSLYLCRELTGAAREVEQVNP